jgi:hypothetical protein
MYTFLVFILFTFASCASNRPMVTTHTERIETKMQPIELPTDSVVVVLASPTPQPVKILSFEASRPARISHSYYDTLQQIKIDLKPDTVFVPYMTHIRSDTIVAPCPTTQAKLTTARWQIFALILILIAIIIYRLKPFFINP